ncbi:hypothetical protein D3C73_1610050 [compost metagenome]
MLTFPVYFRQLGLESILGASALQLQTGIQRPSALSVRLELEAGMERLLGVNDVNVAERLNDADLEQQSSQ